MNMRPRTKTFLRCAACALALSGFAGTAPGQALPPGAVVAQTGDAQTAPARPAGPLDPLKADLTRQIFAVDGFDKLVRQVEGQTLTRTYQVMAQNPLFPRGFLVALSKGMTDRVNELDAQSILVARFAGRFSTEELREILAFESSPTGKKLATTQAALLGEVQPEVAMWSRKTAQEVTRKLLNEHPEWAREIAENRQRQNADLLRNGGTGARTPLPGPVK